MEKEIWKDIAGFEGKYQISNYGNVKSFYLKGKLLKTRLDKAGYVRVSLSINKQISKQYLIHRLVALHFIPNPNNYREINHIDANKQNNYFENLEWCTRKENIQHAERLGLMYHPWGENHPGSKSFFQFDLKGNLIKYWKSLSDCARYLIEHDEQVKHYYRRNLSVDYLRKDITTTLHRRHKTCAGYIFSFSPEIDINKHKWNYETKPVIATDKKTNEEYRFDKVTDLDNYIMPNGKRVFATLVVKVCKHKRESHAGYYWRYA